MTRMLTIAAALTVSACATDATDATVPTEAAQSGREAPDEVVVNEELMHFGAAEMPGVCADVENDLIDRAVRKAEEAADENCFDICERGALAAWCSEAWRGQSLATSNIEVYSILDLADGCAVEVSVKYVCE